MTSHFRKELAINQGKALKARLKRLEAEFAEYEDMGLSEDPGALNILEQITDIEAKGAALTRLWKQEEARNRPRAKMTEAEFLSMSPEEMKRRADMGDCEAIDRIFSKSKYYDKDQWSDPDVRQRVFDAVQEIQLRKGVENGG
jgi:hypothetical protein